VAAQAAFVERLVAALETREVACGDDAG
jgi:hypothetical protein